jgi:hypothetical protein
MCLYFLRVFVATAIAAERVLAFRRGSFEGAVQVMPLLFLATKRRVPRKPVKL